MSRYDDYRSSTGTLESPRFDAGPLPRERLERFHPREPPVLERPHRGDRFESRLHETDRYGPPARRPDRSYDDDPLVRPTPRDNFRGVSPTPRPRLLRRQSSLDTFDRIPSRKMDEYYYRGSPPRPIREPVTPSLRYSPPPHPDDFYYEDIHIAEPEYYGDEELRGFRDREPYPTRPRRSSSRVSEKIVEEPFEKPYPRKGKTRMPKKLVHPRAIIDKHYPFEEQGDMVMIQVALSKDQIDELVQVSREIRRRNESKQPCDMEFSDDRGLTVGFYVYTARIPRTSPSPVRESHSMDLLSVPTHSARSSRGTLYLERSPSRHRSHSRHHHHHSEHSGHRSVSVVAHRRRRSSPVRSSHRHESDDLHTGPLAVMIRPRDNDSDEDLRLIEPPSERYSGGELIRHSDSLNVDEEIEVRKERKCKTQEE